MPSILTREAWFLSLRHCEEALAVLHRAIEIDPVNPLAKLRKAMALAYMERYEEVSMAQLRLLACLPACLLGCNVFLTWFYRENTSRQNARTDAHT